MTYNFDEIIPRRGTNCVKWDSCDDNIIPAWVADMDFKTAPCIIDALMKRAEHGVFGYTHVSDDYYRAIDTWFKTRHDWSIDAQSVIYTTGVVPAISAIIKAMTKPGDGVIIQSPVYNCFFSSIRNNKCQIVDTPLIYHPEGYEIDFDALENAAARPDVTCMLICNPHNPVGRVWTRNEMLKMADICLRNNVFVISDEIHCELTYSGHDYTPYNTLGEQYANNAAVCISPSKAFNIAGLQIANIVAVNPDIKAKIDRAINDNEVCDVNPFGVVGLIAAYNQGAEWLDQLREYLYQNYLMVKDFFTEKLPQYPVLPLQGTYLVWINCEASGLDSQQLTDLLVREERVMPNPGSMYGSTGQNFLRLNIACPRQTLSEILNRMYQLLNRVL